MIIDCHAHLVPASLLEAVRKEAGKFPSLRLIEDGASFGFSFAGGKPTRPVAKPLIDIAGRLAWMDAQASIARWSAAGSTCSATNSRQRKASAGRGWPTSISRRRPITNGA